MRRASGPNLGYAPAADAPSADLPAPALSARSDGWIERISFRRPTDQITTHDPEVQYRLRANLKQPALGAGLNIANNRRHGVQHAFPFLVERYTLHRDPVFEKENLVFSRRLLEGQGVDAAGAIVVVTSDFHVRRAVGIARKAGFAEAFGVGTETPLYLRFNAWLREYFAAISSWVLREY